MQSETTYSLKQKLAKSRSVWLINVKFRFLSTLYAILDNSKYQNILSWSEDGRVILIKNEDELVSKVLCLFEDCPTLISFFRRLESCFFAEVYDSEYQGNAYEHLHFTREKRPDFKSQKKGKKLSEGIFSCDVSTIGDVEEDLEMDEIKVRKIVKKESEDDTFYIPSSFLSEEKREEINRLNTIIMHLQSEVLLESMKKRTLQMSILSYGLETASKQLNF